MQVSSTTAYRKTLSRSKTLSHSKTNSTTSDCATYSLSNCMYTSSSTSLDRSASHFSDSASRDNERLVAIWSEKLLMHFGLSELDAIAQQEITSLLERCDKDDLSAFEDRSLLLDLKRRIVRTAGARLDSTFIAMSSEVIEEADAEAVSLKVEDRKLQGLRYQGEIYRLTDAFLPCHRLQAFCLGQTLQEQKTAFIITQSPERFAVWVSVKAFTHCRPSLPAYHLNAYHLTD